MGSNQSFLAKIFNLKLLDPRNFQRAASFGTFLVTESSLLSESIRIYSNSFREAKSIELHRYMFANSWAVASTVESTLSALFNRVKADRVQLAFRTRRHQTWLKWCSASASNSQFLNPPILCFVEVLWWHLREKTRELKEDLGRGWNHFQLEKLTRKEE